mmetsp:Transcript_7583/g.11478  ORF Transcript_7583/g.11478 Transcript_7583/m.11478 type:complete len:198 (+) Transcript_7583:66-659(+)
MEILPVPARKSLRLQKLVASAVAVSVLFCLGVAYASVPSRTPLHRLALPVTTARAVASCPATCARARPINFMYTKSRNLGLRGGAMTEIAKGVSFDTVAREWRMKWSGDADKASLIAAQEALNEIIAEVKAVPGVKSVQRVVCGGCLDFKVVTSLEADKFGDWEGAKFEPEEKFLEKVKSIPGITFVETQTYTLMPM